MKEDAWLKRMKENLQDYSEPLPEAGWERLENALPRRKILPFRRWMMAAALLAGAAFLGLRLADRDAADLPSSALSPAPRLTADVWPAPSNSEPAPLVPSPIVHPQARPAVFIESPEPTASAEAHSSAKSVNAGKKSDIIEEKGKKQERKKATALPDASDPLLLALADKPRARSKGWSVGLSVGNNGGLGQGVDGNGNAYFQQNAPASGYLDLSSVSEGVLTIPKEQELVFQNGLPYLQNRSRRVVSVDHKQPISAGVSFRKNLPKGFSVETGLYYTLLASDLLYEGNVEKTSQKLHYLGIPLRANWNFMDRKRFTLYVSAGGAVEKCVHGKIGEETVTVDPLQWSVMAAVGAQYNLGAHIGIYVEPGVSYFFDDGSEVRTIRKDTPCNFTLQAGLRLSY